MTNTAKQVLEKGQKILCNASIDNYKYDAEIIFQETFHWDRVKLLTSYNELVDELLIQQFFVRIEDRVKGKPTQYILEHQEFMGLDFKVTPSVLIPRQDTETLIETIIEYHKVHDFKKFMEIGTGSGCIPISLCSFFKNIEVVTMDISKEALTLAEENARKNQVLGNITFIESNLFANVPASYKGTIDCLVSNPPYIPSRDIETLSVEVKEYEPHLALDGGTDGLDFYRIIVKDAKQYLRDQGYLFFEIGYDQGPDLTQMLEREGYSDIKVLKDLADKDRVVIGKYNKEVKKCLID